MFSLKPSEGNGLGRLFGKTNKSRENLGEAKTTGLEKNHSDEALPDSGSNSQTVASQKASNNGDVDARGAMIPRRAKATKRYQPKTGEMTDKEKAAAAQIVEARSQGPLKGDINQQLVQKLIDKDNTPGQTLRPEEHQRLAEHYRQLGNNPHMVEHHETQAHYASLDLKTAQRSGSQESEKTPPWGWEHPEEYATKPGTEAPWENEGFYQVPVGHNLDYREPTSSTLRREDSNASGRSVSTDDATQEISTANKASEEKARQYFEQLEANSAHSTKSQSSKVFDSPDDLWKVHGDPVTSTSTLGHANSTKTQSSEVRSPWDDLDSEIARLSQEGKASGHKIAFNNPMKEQRARLAATHSSPVNANDAHSGGSLNLSSEADDIMRVSSDRSGWVSADSILGKDATKQPQQSYVEHPMDYVDGNRATVVRNPSSATTHSEVSTNSSDAEGFSHANEFYHPGGFGSPLSRTNSIDKASSGSPDTRSSATTPESEEKIDWDAWLKQTAPKQTEQSVRNASTNHVKGTSLNDLAAAERANHNFIPSRSDSVSSNKSDDSMDFWSERDPKTGKIINEYNEDGDFIGSLAKQEPITPIRSSSVHSVFNDGDYLPGNITSESRTTSFGQDSMLSSRPGSTDASPYSSKNTSTSSLSDLAEPKTPPIQSGEPLVGGQRKKLDRSRFAAFEGKEQPVVTSKAPDLPNQGMSANMSSWEDFGREYQPTKVSSLGNHIQEQLADKQGRMQQ